jgi:hypothetical protein
MTTVWDALGKRIYIQQEHETDKHKMMSVVSNSKILFIRTINVDRTEAARYKFGRLSRPKCFLLGLPPSPFTFPPQRLPRSHDFLIPAEMLG